MEKIQIMSDTNYQGKLYPTNLSLPEGGKREHIQKDLIPFSVKTTPLLPPTVENLIALKNMEKEKENLYINQEEKIYTQEKKILHFGVGYDEPKSNTVYRPLPNKKIEPPLPPPPPQQVVESSNGSSAYQKLAGPSYKIQNQKIAPVVFADFSDGYTCRQMFEFFRLGLPNAPMFFSDNGITIEGANGLKTLYVKCYINRKNLVGYYFDPNNCNDKENNRHIINYQLPDFLIQVKSLAKKESIRIRHFKDSPDHVFGQFYGGNKTTAQGSVYFRTQKYEPASYDIDDGVTEETLPNQVVPLASFCSVCASIVHHKYPFASFIVYPQGVRIVSGSDTGSAGIHEGWGDFYEDEEEDPNEIDQPFITYVSLADVKALAKTSNLNTQGIVRIYSTRNQIIRLEIPTGTLAETMVILQGRDPQSIIESSVVKKKNK